MENCEFSLNNKKDQKGRTVYAMFQNLKQMIIESFFTIVHMLHILLNNGVICLKTTSIVALYNNKIKKHTCKFQFIQHLSEYSDIP